MMLPKRKSRPLIKGDWILDAIREILVQINFHSRLPVGHILSLFPTIGPLMTPNLKLVKVLGIFHILMLMKRKVRPQKNGRRIIKKTMGSDWVALGPKRVPLFTYVGRASCRD